MLYIITAMTYDSLQLSVCYATISVYHGMINTELLILIYIYLALWRRVNAQYHHYVMTCDELTSDPVLLSVCSVSITGPASHQHSLIRRLITTTNSLRPPELTIQGKTKPDRH